MWWSGGSHMGAGGWVGMGFMILFWIVVVIGVVYLVRYLVHPGADRWHDRPPHWQATGPLGSPQGKSDALRILEERYARGEIDQEEFQRRQADLTS